MPPERRDLAGRQRELRLETLYDLLVALHAHRSEEQLLEELMERVCAAVDPSAAAAVTRDPHGEPASAVTVGWKRSPDPGELLHTRLAGEILATGEPLVRHAGRLAERDYSELLAVPLDYRGEIYGYLAVLDKERRSGGESSFTAEDERFLQSVAALAGVTLDGLRRFETLRHRSERLEEENKLLKEQLVHEVGGLRIIAEAPSMRRALAVAERVAPRSVNVLIRGASGTGKELIARLLHQRSERRGPLVAVNCAALPESLLESELFGIEGGVATGVQARTGKFELAHEGTLFLDEIGDLQISLQVKLLRALQEREVVRIGGHKPTAVDVRVVTATHQPLEELVAEGRFREDLYYRLKGVEIGLPPLRERREDIPHLVRFVVERFAAREGLSPPRVTSDALSLLLTYDFPGNVRELQGVVEGAVSLAEDEIDAKLLASLLGLGDPTATAPEALDLETVERRHIRRVLELTGGNKTTAARLLGIDRRTLSRRGF